MLLNCRLATPKIAWVAFALMIVGAVMTTWPCCRANSSVMFTSYLPMQATPHFYLGLILFAVGALIAVFVFFGTLVIARQERTYEGSIPLVTFGAITAAIIAVFTIVSGAIILIPTFLWSIGLVSHIDSLMYKVIWWGMGHSSQQINVAAHVAVWYAIAALVLGRQAAVREGQPQCLPALHLLPAARGRTPHARRSAASPRNGRSSTPATRCISPCSRQHDPRPERSGRDRGGATAQRLHPGRLRVAAQGALGQSGLRRHVLSLVMFGIVGGITGVVLGAEQLNLLMHNTLYVPGHFHGTVVAGTTLAFMGITYLLVPLIFRRD